MSLLNSRPEISVFFWVRKSWFQSDCKLSHAGSAIVPIILYFQVRPDGNSYPSVKTISTLAGLSPRTVQRGPRSLERAGLPGLSFDGRKYHYSRGAVGDEFTVSRKIIFRNWASLKKNTARALFLSLAARAKFNANIRFTRIEFGRTFLPLAKPLPEKYPGIILKGAGKLFFDLAAWEREVEKVREQQVEQAKHLQCGCF